MELSLVEKDERRTTALPAGSLESTFVEGVSPSLRAVEVMIRELAQSDVPVLLLAETGAGKRATAQRIHQMSKRNAGEFQVFDCAGLTPERLEQADIDEERLSSSGTLLLNEIAELDATCQKRLLELLPQAEKQGGSDRISRLIFSSARDLESEIRTGRFREDLYYRISGVCLRLPPLRQRKDDIPYLVSFFLSKNAQELQRSMPVLSAETKRLFQEYDWPGNIRELEDAARAIVALGDEALAMRGLRSILKKSSRSASGDRISLKQAARAASREAEKELILKALTRTRWNRRRAAQELQISYKALLYKLKQIGCGEYEAS